MKKYIVYKTSTGVVLWQFIPETINEYKCIQCTDTDRFEINEINVYWVRHGNYSSMIVETDDYDEALTAYLLEAV